MRKERRKLLLAGVVVVAVVGGLAWWALPSRLPKVPDPVYDGHSLSYWVDPSTWPRISGSSPVPRPAAGLLDSNAVPYLIQALNRRDGAVRTAYNQLWPHLPGWLSSRLATPRYAWRIRENACRYLGDLGAQARPAIPELVRLLREDVTMVKIGAAEALWRIVSRDDHLAIEGLIAATKDNDTTVREIAAQALNYIDPEAAAKAGIK